MFEESRNSKRRKPPKSWSFEAAMAQVKELAKVNPEGAKRLAIWAVNRLIKELK